MDPVFHGVFEKRQFDFFRSRTIPSSDSYLACRFWDRVVPQLCHAEPCIKHAVLVLATLHQLFGSPYEDLESRRQQLIQVNVQYARAITCARQMLEKQPNVHLALVACILFICCENVRCRPIEAQTHLHNGLKILEQHTSKIFPVGTAASHTDIEEAGDMLRRLDCSALLFSDARKPHKTIKLQVDAMSVPSSPKEPKTPKASITIGYLRTQLMTYIKLYFGIATKMSNAALLGEIATVPALLLQRVEVVRKLKVWKETFDCFVIDLPAPSKSQHCQGITMLQTYYEFADLSIVVGWTGPETRFDRHMDKFKELLRLCTNLVELTSGQSSRTQSSLFGFEMGIISPLVAVSHRCRDPIVRRQAIDLLYSSRRQEGAVSSFGAAIVSDAILRREEHGLVNVQGAADIPERNRVIVNAVRVDAEKSILVSTTMTKPCGPCGPFDISEEILYYSSPFNISPSDYRGRVDSPFATG